MPSDMVDAGRACLAMSAWVKRLITMAESCGAFETPTARPGFNPIDCPRQTWGADRTGAQRYRVITPVRSRSSSRAGWGHVPFEVQSWHRDGLSFGFAAV
jgi:hypothetical protein